MPNKAEFLWPHDDDSVEEAGYELVNAGTEPYRQQWWNILLERARATAAPSEMELRRALEESLKLQTHYAKLLNMHDGGERIGFPTVESWLKRLKETTWKSKSTSQTSKTSKPESSAKKRA